MLWTSHGAAEKVSWTDCHLLSIHRAICSASSSLHASSSLCKGVSFLCFVIWMGRCSSLASWDTEVEMNVVKRLTVRELSIVYGLEWIIVLMIIVLMSYKSSVAIEPALQVCG